MPSLEKLSILRITLLLVLNGSKQFFLHKIIEIAAHSVNVKCPADTLSIIIHLREMLLFNI